MTEKTTDDKHGKQSFAYPKPTTPIYVLTR